MSGDDDAAVEAIRAIIGPSDTALTRARILELLAAAGGDPNKAVDLYFQGPPTTTTTTPTAAAAAAVPTTATATATAGAAPASNKDEAQWPPAAQELQELLGGDVSRDVIRGLLARTRNNLPKAVEMYFAEHHQGAAAQDRDVDVDDDDDDDDDDDEVLEQADTNESVARPEHNELFPAPATTSTTEPPEIKPVAQHPLEPLTPHPHTDSASAGAAGGPVVGGNGASSTPPSSAELESLLAPGTYEVIMVDGHFRWQIGNVFGRAVVQHVDPLGPAARAGIHKSDVLLSFRDTVINEHNCAHIVQELSKERIVVPSSMRLRRAPDAAHPHAAAVPAPPVPTALMASSPPKATKAPSSPEKEVCRPGPRRSESVPMPELEEDGDVRMDDAPNPQNGTCEPKYGLQVLCHATASMMDAIGAEGIEKKVLVDLLLTAEFNLDAAVNNFLNEHRVVSDFRRVVGHNLDPAQPGKCLESDPYRATIPAGPLGLTVENILERTIVVDIKPGGAAERASIQRSSWLVTLNGTPVTHLTHKETLRMIETAARPLELQLILVPQDDYRQLRKQLSMNIRQPKTERPIPEQDRMSFRVFQLKIHQAVLVMPKILVVALFQHLTSEHISPLSGPEAYDPLESLIVSIEDADVRLVEEAKAMSEERNNEMCDERKFLLNLFASIHDYEDKGESIVIRTIQFLGWLARRYALMQKHIDTHPSDEADEDPVHTTRYTLLLSVITHVLECLSIIENHATWDVMVDAFRVSMEAMTDRDVLEMIVPMICRLSISPSPTARIVPVALLPLVYPRVVGDLRVQLRGMLDRMCNDDNPLVRRAIASIIGDLVNSGGSATAQWGVQLLEKATADSHDIVRIFAVKSCIRLARDLRRILHASKESTPDVADQTLRLLNCQMVPMVNTYTSDSSWQVRLEAAKTLPEFCVAFGPEYMDVFVDHFVGMVRDPTVEIRRTCAESLFDLGQALIELAKARNHENSETGMSSQDVSSVEDVAAELEGIEIKAHSPGNGTKSEYVIAAQAKIIRSLLPGTYGLSTDLSVAVRLALAKSVGKTLQLLPSSCYDDLVPIFTQILDETQDSNVRASLLEEMARHCDHSSPTISVMLVPAVKVLRTSGQWRVRVKFVHCVGAWAEQCERSSVPNEFADATLELLSDAIHEVRAAACSALPTLARSMGSDWLVSKALPRISQCLQSTFNGRVTALLAIECTANELKATDKLREVIESVVAECTSTTPNLRFRALRSLAYLVPLLDDRSTTESTIEFVRPLMSIDAERDADVRDTAASTLEQLEAHLHKMPTE